MDRLVPEGARHLDVVVLEAEICGGGPSGRNGGFVDGWWEKIRDVRDVFGDADAMEP